MSSIKLWAILYVTTFETEFILTIGNKKFRKTILPFDEQYLDLLAQDYMGLFVLYIKYKNSYKYESIACYLSFPNLPPFFTLFDSFINIYKK